MPYNLENLSWQEFERLTKFYLKEKIGEGLWVFDGSQDMGRDAAFSGTANEFPSKTAPYNGDWIFQVKHRTTRGKTIKQSEDELLRTLGNELEKIFVKHNFHCDNYIYITNLNISNQYRDKAKDIFNNFCLVNGLKKINFDVREYKDFDVYISNSQTVRYSFPSLLEFADLERAFLLKEETKNKGYIKFAQENIDKFVSTEHYLEAVHRISKNSLLMLVGNPKSGKTSIVEALSLCFLEEGKFKPHFIKSTDEFFTITTYLPPSEGALFICDDIFGKHELDQSKLSDWTDYFQSVVGLIDENRKFIFTTRQYIYEEFANKSGLRAFFPNETDTTRYVVRLNELSDDERDQILDKHLRTSNLSIEAIELVQNSKEEILECKDFSPEVVRSLIALISKVAIGEIPQIIAHHISQPNAYLYEFFNNLNVQKRLLLLSIAVSATAETPDVESSFFNLLNDAAEHPQIGFQPFLDEIEGSIVKRREYLDSSEIEYYHPSMYDSIIEICKKDKYYRNLMLKNVNLELLYLITFRNVDEGSIKIQVLLDEVNTLIEGMERFINKEIVLADISRTLQWIGFINTEISYNLSLLKPFNAFKGVMKARLSDIEFFEVHKQDRLENWINVLDKSSVIVSTKPIQYINMIEATHRNYASFDYWRLMFLLENSQQGFIEHALGAQVLNEFTQKLIKVVTGLRQGLKITDGKPKTYETWYPMFREVDDLMTKMKKSGTGRQIIDSYLIHDWNEVKKFSEFSKNRHAGMVKSGYWKTFKHIRNFQLLP